MSRYVFASESVGEGHFGKDDPDITWERVDKVEALLKAVKRAKAA